MTATSEPRRVRLLVVDDSAYNRRNIADIFASEVDVEVVGKAADGEEALKLANTLHPDVITLDLEMPRMDGFTFLRILMARQPTPVIVVSSYSQRENVFKALELGALDFVAKPDRQIMPDAAEVKAEILQKVRMVKTMRPTSRVLKASKPVALQPTPSPKAQQQAPSKIVGIASSTGGPTALLEIFGKLPEKLPAAILVAQHMPDKFTRTFAERLDKKGNFRVTEAQDGDMVWAQTAFVCPGRQCMEIAPSLTSGEFRLRTGMPGANDRYVPSADRMLKSLATHLGSKAVAVVLTGMGDDGLEGAKAVREAGGLVVAESHETAVVFGMPGAVVKAGIANHVLPLPAIADLIAGL